MAYVPTLNPVIVIHLTSALAGLALGPVVLWARKGAIQRPRLHRAARTTAGGTRSCMIRGLCFGVFCSLFCVVVPRALWRKAYCCRDV